MPNITKYHHFSLDRDYPGIVVAKKTINGEKSKHNILKKSFPYGPNKVPRSPKKLKPSGISLERSWYLYEIGICMKILENIFPMRKIKI